MNAAETAAAALADVPDDLVQSGADLLAETTYWTGWERDQSEQQVRKILAAVLPIHEQQVRERLGLTEPTTQWSVRWPDGTFAGALPETEARERLARNDALTLARRIVGEWQPADAAEFPDVCPRCHGSRKVPDWKNWNTEYGEPRPKPCPDCADSLDTP